MLHHVMCRFKQRVALDDVPKGLCHAVKHHVQTKETGGFIGDILRIHNGAVHLALFTESIRKVQYQGSASRGRVVDLCCLDPLAHSNQNRGDDTAHRLGGKVLRVDTARHIVLGDQVLENGTVKVECVPFCCDLAEVEPLLCDDLEDVLHKVVLLGFLNAVRDTVEKGVLLPAGGLDLEAFISYAVGDPSQCLVDLLRKILVFIIRHERLDRIRIAESDFTGIGVIEGIQLVVLVQQDFLDRHADLFGKLSKVVHELVVKELIKEHVGDDPLFGSLIGEAVRGAESLKLVYHLFDL